MPNYSPFISKSIEISKATFKQDRLDNKDKEFFAHSVLRYISVHKVVAKHYLSLNMQEIL